jgi:hypothetical protein
MAHLHFVEDADGDVVDHVVFCSDFCHNDYCCRENGFKYGGWNGCNEISTSEPCANCDDLVCGEDEEGDRP